MCSLSQPQDGFPPEEHLGIDVLQPIIEETHLKKPQPFPHHTGESSHGIINDLAGSALASLNRSRNDCGDNACHLRKPSQCASICK